MKRYRILLAFGLALYPSSYCLAMQDERFGLISSVPGDEANNILGNCRSGTEQSFYPREFVFLKNRHVRWSSGDSMVEFKVDGERLWTYGRVNNIGERTRVPHQIDYFISDGVELDIEMDPVLFNGKLYVYWRETFRHRSYRQGLIEIIGMTPSKVCEGRGGVDQGSPH